MVSKSNTWKRRAPIVGVACVAVLAFSAITAGAAQANTPRWKVGGAYLAAGVSVPFKLTSGVTRFNTRSLGIVIVCQKDTGTGSIVGSAAGSPGTNKEVVLTFEECSVEGAPKCEVGNAEHKIVTEKLKSELVWLSKEGNNAGDRLTPETGEVFTNFTITGSCAVTGTWPYTGEIVGSVLPIAGEALTDALEFPDAPLAHYWTGDRPNRVEHANNGMRGFGANPTTFESTESLTLNSGKKFGVFE